MTVVELLDIGVTQTSRNGGTTLERHRLSAPFLATPREIRGRVRGAEIDSQRFKYQGKARSTHRED